MFAGDLSFLRNVDVYVQVRVVTSTVDLCAVLASGLKRNGGLSLQVQNRARPCAAHSPLGAT